MSDITFGMRTDIGLVREENQDSAGHFPHDSLDESKEPGVLFVVADGMGGHRGGKEASRLAVETLRAEFFEGPDGSIPERLRRGFEKANEVVRSRGTSNPELRGMGTTVTALVLSGGKATIAHVGDSRAYRISETGISQLTDDHSIVAEWQRKGWITEEQARDHPERSLLYRALGVGHEIAVDVLEDVPFENGDAFLLCTDGLTNHVGEEEMLAAAGKPPPEACDDLVALALERGGLDNITVQIIRYSQPGRSETTGQSSS